MTDSAGRDAYERVVRRLDPDGALKHYRPLVGGVSAGMVALTFRRSDGRAQTVIVRHPAAEYLDADPHAAQHEFEVLTAVREAGVRAPLTYFYDESGSILTTPYLVIAHIEGEPVFTTSDTVSFAQELAAQMARIHAVDFDRPAFRLLPQQSAQLERRILDATQLDESIGQGRLLEALQSIWPLPQINAPALLHGDLWPGNLIWRAGHLVGVIDWEDALVGDPLLEIAQTRLDLLWAFGWPMVTVFTDACRALTAVDFSLLPYWDLVAAARPAHYLSAWAMTWPLVGRPDVSSSTMRRDLWEFADRALAAVAALT